MDLLRWLQTLKQRPVRRYMLAFVLILLPSAGLYLSAAAGAPVLSFVLLGLVVLGNLLVLLLG